jgi:hypothetical protein
MGETSPNKKKKEVEKIRDKIIEKLRFLTDLVTDILDEIIDLRTEMETEIDIYSQGTFQEMPSLQAYACNKERQEKNTGQSETMLEMQALPIPIYNAKFIQEKRKEKEKKQ